MKRHARAGMMVVWVISVSAVIGLLCLSAVRSSTDFLELAIDRVRYQQNVRVLRIMKEYASLYVTRYFDRTSGYQITVTLPDGLLPSCYRGDFEVDLQSKQVQVTLHAHCGTSSMSSRFTVAKN